MKRLFKIILCAAVFVSAAFSAQAQLGVDVSYLNSRYSSKTSAGIKTTAPMNGFGIGVNYNFDIVAGLSLRPGLRYAYLTDSRDQSVALDVLGNFSVKERHLEHYLEIPVQLAYTFHIVKGVDFSVFTGPVLSLGLANYFKTDVNGSILGININGDMKYDNYTGKIASSNIDDSVLDNVNDALGHDNVYNRFDLQYGLGVGFRLFDFVEIRGGYDWGLLNRIESDDVYTRRDAFYVTVGIRF